MCICSVCVLQDEDDEFIPLLTIQPGFDGAAAADAAAAGGSSSGLQEKQQQRAAGYQPPWLPRLAHFSSPLMRLHNEIVAFCQMLAPTAEEVRGVCVIVPTVLQSLGPGSGFPSPPLPGAAEAAAAPSAAAVSPSVTSWLLK